MAEILRYVDPNSTAGGDGTTNALTGDNRAYVSLNAWEAAEQQDLTDGAGDTARVVCSSDDAGSTHAADTTPVSISGWTTSATSYISITTANSHGGKWNTARYRLEANSASTHAISISEDYVRINGIQAKNSQTAAERAAITTSTITSAAASALWFSNLVVAGSANGSAVILNAGTCYLWNSVVYGATVDGINITFGAHAPTVSVYSTTSCANGAYGINRVSGTVTAKNCYCGGNTTADFNGTITQTTCASSDTTATGTGLDSIAYSTATLTNVTGGSEDFHLVVGSGLIDVGTDTSGEGAPLNFSDDIDGVARTGTWDIGADEYVAGGGSAFERNISEAMGLTDSVNRYETMARFLSEALGITDSAPRYVTFLREAQDLLGITDEEVIQAAYLRILSDDLGVSDSTFRSQGHGRYVTDDVGISDAMNTLLFVLIYRTVADSMGITDEQARMVDVVRILSDSMGISDELDKASAIQRIMSETMGMTDSIDRTMAVIRNIADQLDIEDSAHRALTHIRFLAEALGITDSTNATVAAAAVAVWLMIALSLQRMIRVEAAKPFCSISVCRSFITLEAYKL